MKTHQENAMKKRETRDWSNASRSQGMTEATRSEGRGRTFPSACTQLSPDNTLISDLWSPKLWDNAFYCLSYPVCHTQPPLGPPPQPWVSGVGCQTCSVPKGLHSDLSPLYFIAVEVFSASSPRFLMFSPGLFYLMFCIQSTVAATRTKPTHTSG